MKKTFKTPIIKFQIHVILILFFIINISSTLFAQNSKTPVVSKIALMARNGNDSIVLRWLTDDKKVFKNGLQNGYSIFRAENNGNKYGKFNKVADVKLWDKAKWDKTLASYTDTNVQAYKYLKMGYAFTIERAKNVPKEITSIDDIKLAIAQNDLMLLFATMASCMDAQSADAMGLRWVDKNITPGSKYKYRIEAISVPEKKENEGTEIEAVAESPKLNATAKVWPIEGETNILVKWAFPEEPFIGYSMERSDDGGKTFKKINRDLLLIDNTSNEKDSLFGALADSSVKMYVPYVYRAIGHSLFAEEMVIGTCKAMARDRTPVTCIFVPSPDATTAKNAVIKWELTCNPGSDLKGFWVAKDSSVEGKFKTIITPNLLSPATTQFIDYNLNNNSDNFYRILTVDTAGNVFYSNAVYLLRIDTVPPAAPVWAVGKSDSIGIITLKLNANKDKDFFGFRIAKANQADHDFSTIYETFSKDTNYIVNKADTIFHDTVTLKTLTKHIYYRAYALDRNYNVSESSKIIEIKRPDIIPPVAPVLKAVTPTDSCLILTIIPSSSEDAVRMSLYRRAEEDTSFQYMGRMNPKDSIFYDKNLIPEKMYYYTLTASDTDNNTSEFCFAQKAKTYDSGVRKGVENVKAEYDKDSKEIIVSWTYEKDEKKDEEIYFQVYCATGASALERCSTLPFNDGIFMYKNPNPIGKGPYKYAIKVVTSKGAESEFCSEKSVLIPEN
jgi:hypothetical protein